MKNTEDTVTRDRRQNERKTTILRKRRNKEIVNLCQTERRGDRKIIWTKCTAKKIRFMYSQK